MKHTKELQPILTAIYILNHIDGHTNEKVAKLTEYALHEICVAYSNMIKAITFTGGKADLLTYVEKMLAEDTNYNEYFGGKKQ